MHSVVKLSRRRKWQPTPVFLPRESQRTEEPGGLQSLGLKKSDMTEATSHSVHRESLEQCQARSKGHRMSALSTVFHCCLSP